MGVYYEWDVERVQRAGLPDEQDIIDHHHSDKLDFGPRDFEAEPDEFKRLVLVYNKGNDQEGITDRAWAYVSRGQLPDYFTYGMDERGPKVPQRFHIEFARWLKSSDFDAKRLVRLNEHGQV